MSPEPRFGSGQSWCLAQRVLQMKQPNTVLKRVTCTSLLFNMPYGNTNCITQTCTAQCCNQMKTCPVPLSSNYQYRYCAYYYSNYVVNNSATGAVGSVGLSVGLSIGLLVLFAIIAVVFVVIRRRRMMQANLAGSGTTVIATGVPNNQFQPSPYPNTQFNNNDTFQNMPAPPPGLIQGANNGWGNQVYPPVTPYNNADSGYANPSPYNMGLAAGPAPFNQNQVYDPMHPDQNMAKNF